MMKFKDALESIFTGLMGGAGIILSLFLLERVGIQNEFITYIIMCWWFLMMYLKVMKGDRR